MFWNAFLRGMLLLFWPFRNEYEEISSKDLRLIWEEIQTNPLHKEMIQSQIDFYQQHADLVSEMNSFVNDEKEDDEGDYDNDDENEENLIQDVETTDEKDIQEFVKELDKEKVKETDFISKEALLESVRKLNTNQRKICDDIIERLISGDFQTNQFLLYIRYFGNHQKYFFMFIYLFSGDAGTGKSFLFKTIINAAKHILRQSDDFLDQVRVLSLAPSIFFSLTQFTIKQFSF